MTEKEEDQASARVPHEDVRPWWASAVMYQIYPLSFAEKDPEARLRRLAERSVPRHRPDLLENGLGDLAGIADHLDYVSWLGADAIWLTPIFPSPLADFGYDVADYCDVDPIYGDLADFDALVAAAHAKGLRVVMDFVANHTSDMHPWFVASRSSVKDPHRPFYYWRPSRNGPPNNWRSAFTNEPAWTLDPLTNEYYLHLFYPEQPDLNWMHPQVRREMVSAMTFWLDRGVDGFRMDAIHCIGKDPELPDLEGPLSSLPVAVFNDSPLTHTYIREIRTAIKAAHPEALLLGEVFLNSFDKIASYWGDGDELDSAFLFPLAFAGLDVRSWRSILAQVQERLLPRGFVPTWVLENHDIPRFSSRTGASPACMRAANLALALLPGIVCIYQGQELGMPNGDLQGKKPYDAAGRDAVRSPMPWSPEPPYGWTGSPPWSPFAGDPSLLAVPVQIKDEGSMLWLLKRAIELRRSDPACRSLQLGVLEDLPSEVLGYKRGAGREALFVIANFSDRPHELPSRYREMDVVLSSAVQPVSGSSLSPCCTIVLRQA